MNSLQEEFVEYQLMEDSRIPIEVWESATVKVSEQGDKLYRIDTLWGHLSTVKLAGGLLVFSQTVSNGQTGTCNSPLQCRRRESFFHGQKKQNRLSRLFVPDRYSVISPYFEDEQPRVSDTMLQVGALQGDPH